MVLEGEVAAAGFAWFLETFVSPLIGQFKSEMRERWERFDWRMAEKAYRESLLSQYSMMRVLGKNEPVALEGIFTDVYILDKPSARLRYDIQELRQRPFDRFERWDSSRQTRLHGLDLVRKGKNLFILGKPGAGKTTFLKHVVLQTIRGELNRLPIFVSLHEWSKSECTSLFEFIVQQFAICRFPEAKPFIELMLKSGKVIALFDGLDEVRQEDEQRSKTATELRNFAQQYRESQCLITCRNAASDYDFERFSDVEIADFSRDQIHMFAKRWYEQDEEKRAAFIAQLYKDENTGIRELCANPLLLAMLCLAFDETMEIPRRRAELYEECVEILLRRWDAKRNIQRDTIYRDLSHKRKLQLFSEIGFKTFERKEYFIKQTTLEKLIDDFLSYIDTSVNPDLIDSTAILKSIEAQHSILVERAQGIYSFAHLTFQEYFAARYIAENEARGTIDKLMLRVDDTQWREVFLLTASLLSNADGLLLKLCEHLDTCITKDLNLALLTSWIDSKTSKCGVEYSKLGLISLAYTVLGVVDLRQLQKSVDLVSDFSVAKRRVNHYRQRAISFVQDDALQQLRAFADSTLSTTLNVLTNYADIEGAIAETIYQISGYSDYLQSVKLNDLDLDNVESRVEDALDIYPSREQNRRFIITKEQILELGHKYSGNFAREFGLMCAWYYASCAVASQAEQTNESQLICKECLEVVLVFTERKGQGIIFKTVQQLLNLCEKDLQSTWFTISSKLQHLIDQSVYHEYHLIWTDEHAQEFHRYLMAKTLLLRSVSLAILTNRQQIISRALVMPVQS